MRRANIELDLNSYQEVNDFLAWCYNTFPKEWKHLKYLEIIGYDYFKSKHIFEITLLRDEDYFLFKLIYG